MAPNFNNIIFYFEQYGVLDFLLPFILVFTITFAILEKAKIFGSGDRNKTFNTIISFVLGMLFVVPHVLGRYPPNYDPVVVLNQALPSISLLAIAIIMSLMLLGLFGKKYGDKFLPLIGLASIIFLIYVFGSALGIVVGPWDLFSWWTPEVTELMVIITVFALIIYFVTRGNSKTNWKGNLGAALNGMFQNIDNPSSREPPENGG